LLAVTVVVGSIGSTTGCSSSGARFASLNPFSKPAMPSETVPKPTAEKPKNMFAGWFGKKQETAPGVVEGDETDPLSLAHQAEVTPEVFVANGRLWESTGNFDKAKESYEKAIEKDPKNAAALANIARLHFRNQEHERAAEYFGKAIKQTPEDAGLYNDLGLTLSKLGNHGAAATTIEQALRLAPGSSRYANNLASVKFEGGDPAGALQVLVKNNKPAVAHFNMAYLHYKHGQGTEAQRHLNEALKFAPQADSDPATKRAVERSQELLAQINNVPGMPAGTAIAQGESTRPSSKSATPAAAAAPYGASQPAANVASVSQQSSPQASVETAATRAQPASGQPSGIRFGTASFRSEPGSTPAKTASSQQAPDATGVAAPVASGSTGAETGTTPSTDASAPTATGAAGGGFSLPTNFQFPN
jgi:tetratricopeptide (TPR) repeat protein